MSAVAGVCSRSAPARLIEPRAMSDVQGDSPRPRMVLGLGNPGSRYDGTRHNVGFRVVAELARRRQQTLAEGECRSQITEVDGLLLVAPQTFMNRSGHAARCLVDRRRLPTKDMLVVYDEVHLPLGMLRLRSHGSPGGHRGMESVLESLGTDQVPRLRLGVGSAEGPTSGEDLVEYVLDPFDRAEQARVEQMIERAADACELWAREGAEAAMQRFNGPPPEPGG